MKAITADNLTKLFGRLVAVDHLSFEVEEGEVFGFLGPNGAGKTTTVMMLATALNPDYGSATVCGYDIRQHKDKVRECIAILFQEPSLDTSLTARENLDFHARLYHLPRKVREERISQALELVGLTDKANTLVKYYSGGMQRRLEIARCMLTSPRVLFLDEPTLGLDVQTRRLLWDYVRKLNHEQGTTIVLNTHYVEEADQLCDRVALLERGRIVVVDSPGALKDSLGDRVLSIEFGGQELAARFAHLLVQTGWVREVSRHNARLELSLAEGGARIPEIVRLARSRGITISSISEYKPSLEDIFLRYVGRKLSSDGT